MKKWFAIGAVLWIAFELCNVWFIMPKSVDYETGASRSVLTGTDTASWHDKSWVVGISANGHDKAYDWSRLTPSTRIPAATE